MNISTPVSRLAEFLFPSGCLLCGASLLQGDYPFIPLCRECAEGIREGMLPHTGRCAVCGTIITSEDSVCLRCREREYAFDSHRSLYRYRGEIKLLLSAYKGSGYRTLSRFFAGIVAEYCSRYHPGIPVVPVPARPASIRKRGFHNTGLICRHLSSDFGLVTLDLLRRKNGQQQKTLNYARRFSNISGMIVPASRIPVLPDRILLFDDVFTSGATAHTSALVLKEIGVRWVDVLTLAQD